MLTEQRENDAALSAINRLQGEGRRHIHAMRIALSANLQSGRWDEALKAVRLLEKRNALHPVLARRLKCTIYRELFDSAEQLTRRRSKRCGARCRKRSGSRRKLHSRPRDCSTSRMPSLARLRLKRSKRRCSSHPQHGMTRRCALLDEYARAQVLSPRDQLERVEAWLEAAPPTGPIRAGLLRAAGMICLRQQLWGKSKAYLLESLADRPGCGDAARAGTSGRCDRRRTRGRVILQGSCGRVCAETARSMPDRVAVGRTAQR